MFTRCIYVDWPILQRPSKETQDPVFSFKFAVLRPTQWLSAALPRVNPDQAAVFECDVLSDTEDLNEHQIQNLASSIANINKVPLVTLSSDAISQYPYVWMLETLLGVR